MDQRPITARTSLANPARRPLPAARQARRIPATIVTGFLGSGKTTLIRNLLANARGRRLALIINEFGEMGVDGELLKGCGEASCGEDDIVELANGCICCTVADDFLPTMTALLDRPAPPEHIVIETSGLAMPKPLIKAFQWPPVQTRTTVDGVIAVVDAAAVADGRYAADPDAVDRQRRADAALDHESPLVELLEEQLAAADMVILNKADLLPDGDIDSVRRLLDPLMRPGIGMVPAEHGRIAAEVLLGLGAAAESDLANRPSEHDGADDHDHDDFTSFSVALEPAADLPALAMRARRVLEDRRVLRVKGFVDVPGKPMRGVIQGVGGRVEHYFDRPWKPGEARGTRLVVIGTTGMDRAAATALLTG
ncbi:MAG: cobalamin biosynthesis protein CobW [Alphaproteobacteria bacterium]|jgi:cobalamin biosynthesis protein CobW|nr:cobalamin biosynthesis protein CobW [Alphaproteobacteria bacterium]